MHRSYRLKESQQRIEALIAPETKAAIDSTEFDWPVTATERPGSTFAAVLSLRDRAELSKERPAIDGERNRLTAGATHFTIGFMRGIESHRNRIRKFIHSLFGVMVPSLNSGALPVTL